MSSGDTKALNGAPRAALTRASTTPVKPLESRTAPPSDTIAHSNGISGRGSKALQTITEAEGASTTKGIETASSIDDIYACLSNLSVQESKVNQSLKSLLALQNELSRELGRLDLIRARLGSQVVTARGLATGMLSNAATTARRISSAVHKLDVEQERVKETLAMVESVVELKTCVLGVTESMGDAQDWETAAIFLDRASKVPQDVVRSTFAEEIVPTAEVPDPPSVTLNNAAESLCGLFIREFEKATSTGDGGKVTRFFKLFPLIGKGDTGMDIYGKYVCGGVVQKARANLNRKKEGSTFYAGVFSQLFEYTANLVEVHTPLVEKHYGKGKMVRVIERIQVEVDTQGGIIIDTFWDERGISKKLTDIQAYAFPFIVQSFMPAAPATTRSGTPKPRPSIEDDGIDTKDVDQNLNEMEMMLSRWSLYCKFIARKCTPDSDNLAMPQLLLSSNLSTRVETRLSTPFELMANFFFRRSVEKAFQLDDQPLDLHLQPNKPIKANPPYISSAVDEVMFILSKLLKRVIATHACSLVVKVVGSCQRILETTFIQMIQRKLRDERANIGGNAPPEDRVIAFCILLNNLDLATEYAQKIINTLIDPSIEGGPKLEDVFPFSNNATTVENALNGLATGFEVRSTELLNEGISTLFSQVIRPRIRLIITEVFRDADYLPTESTFSGDIDDQDLTSPVDSLPARFEYAYYQLTIPLRRILTSTCYDKLLLFLAAHIGKLLESRIRSFGGKINELGAIHLERDVTGIIGVVVREGKYGLRDVFTRCVQICMVLNMEEDEVLEMLQRDSEAEVKGGDEDDDDLGDDVDWKLTKEERRNTRSLLAVSM